MEFEELRERIKQWKEGTLSTGSFESASGTGAGASPIPQPVPEVEVSEPVSYDEVLDDAEVDTSPETIELPVAPSEPPSVLSAGQG